jgi:ribosomal protein S18 acetylase RimI-like enzyme
MNDLPESLFANPVWNALQTRHRDFAVCNGNACRYPADVAPFAAVAEPSSDALQQLRSLLTPRESMWLIGTGVETGVGDEYPRVPEISFDETLDTFQMLLPEEVTPPDSRLDAAIEIVGLSGADAPEMVALTTLAFPGFFRKRTCEMGSYYGVRDDAQPGGELIAMGGERLMLDGYTEISGVCTHPAHRGKGLAVSLIWQLVRDHRRDGLVSWLHVSRENRRAIDLYSRMGFTVVRKLTLTRISRRDRS